MIVLCEDCGKEPATEDGLCAGCRAWADANPVPPKGAVIRDGKQRFKGWHYSSAVRWWEDRGR